MHLTCIIVFPSFLVNKAPCFQMLSVECCLLLHFGLDHFVHILLSKHLKHMRLYQSKSNILNFIFPGFLYSFWALKSKKLFRDFIFWSGNTKIIEPLFKACREVILQSSLIFYHLFLIL